MLIDSCMDKVVPMFMKDNIHNLITKAYNWVRNELCEVGLLADGQYLDHIQVYSTSRFIGKIARADGWVWDDAISRPYRWFGFEEGAIYIPASIQLHGYPYLLDTVRHEFAHAWKWTDPEFFEEPWFERHFGGPYSADYSKSGQVILKDCEAFEERFSELGMDRNFASPYAATCPSEDFAETFRVFLAHRKSTPKWPNRPGFRRKVEAVRQAVRHKSRELGL